MEIIEDLHKEGKTVVLITHFMEEAAKADRIAVMNGGRIVMDGKPREIFRRVEELREIGLDVPQVTMLAHELKKRGLNIPDGILTTEELVEALKKIR